MKTGNILRTIGSITKKESLANVSGDIIKNTTVAEADKPYSHYYGQLPEKTKPNSLFIFTENEYSLEEVLRYTQNIEFCSKNQVNVASALIYFAEHTVPALRIRNFPDYQANFDLEDCDRILRVKSGRGQPDSRGIITLLNSAGYHASILEESPGEPAVL